MPEYVRQLKLFAVERETEQRYSVEGEKSVYEQ